MKIQTRYHENKNVTLILVESTIIYKGIEIDLASYEISYLQGVSLIQNALVGL